MTLEVHYLRVANLLFIPALKALSLTHLDADLDLDFLLSETCRFPS